jgi:5'-nucleotidase
MKNKPFLITYSGRKWFVTEPRPKDVYIGDIAHGLALMCRYGGQVQVPYTVAQHSLNVLQAIKEAWPNETPTFQLHGLLHDASEAYLSDLVAPLKHQIPTYLELEAKTHDAIMTGLKLPPLTPTGEKLLKQADNAVLLAERRDLLVVCKYKWRIKGKAAAFRIIPNEDWRITESRFLFEYNQLRAAI